MRRYGGAKSTADPNMGMVAVLLLAVALAALAIVLALAAIRNVKDAPTKEGSQQSQQQSQQPQHAQQPPNWTMSNSGQLALNAVPAYPSTFPPVRTGERILDVRVRNSTPGPPMHPFAIAAGEPFAQVGIVYSLEADARHPLFAREAPYRRNRYQYYVSTDNSSIQISARSKGRDCGEELGCDELYTDDKISVPELGDTEFTVKINNR